MVTGTPSTLVCWVQRVRKRLATRRTLKGMVAPFTKSATTWMTAFWLARREQPNIDGVLAFAALRELDAIVHGMGGHKSSSYHLAGLGDLITTATSEGSHHHELGRRLAREETQNISGEGVHTLEMVSNHQLFNTNEYPLFQLIQKIVERPENVAERIQDYLIHIYQ